MTKDDIVEKIAQLEDRIKYLESQQEWDSGLVKRVKALEAKLLPPFAPKAAKASDKA